MANCQGLSDYQTLMRTEVKFTSIPFK